MAPVQASGQARVRAPGFRRCALLVSVAMCFRPGLCILRVSSRMCILQVLRVHVDSQL